VQLLELVEVKFSEAIEIGGKKSHGGTPLCCGIGNSRLGCGGEGFCC
jgi:hypothetical protein